MCFLAPNLMIWILLLLSAILQLVSILSYRFILHYISRSVPPPGMLHCRAPQARHQDHVRHVSTSAGSSSQRFEMLTLPQGSQVLPADNVGSWRRQRNDSRRRNWPQRCHQTRSGGVDPRVVIDGVGSPASAATSVNDNQKEKTTSTDYAKWREEDAWTSAAVVIY